jgi:hypothetical protein
MVAKRRVLAKDHTIFREGLKFFLASVPEVVEVEVVAEPEDGLQAKEREKQLQPHPPRRRRPDRRRIRKRPLGGLIRSLRQ